jgi:hypothetical protein
MGIPSHKYLKPNRIPEGFAEKKSGVLGDQDKVWSTSEGKFLPASLFPEEKGTDVSEFWFVIKSDQS